jgi:hypothetical protein
MLYYALFNTNHEKQELPPVMQCWGSGTGSACFWASRIWILPFSHEGVERAEIMLAA